MRRLIFFMATFVLVTACAPKAVRVNAPSSTVPTAELTGLASYYAEPYHGRRTASGEVFDSYQELTAAHRTLPFHTIVRVTNTTNGRDVEVRINDRGPFVDGRVIDLSFRAAQQIDMIRAGVAPVRLEILQQAAATARPTPSPASTYTVQVGAFESEAAAENLRRNLAGRYRDVTVQSFSAERTFYRVRVGLAPDLATAEKLARELREESLAPFVVRLN